MKDFSMVIKAVASVLISIFCMNKLHANPTYDTDLPPASLPKLVNETTLDVSKNLEKVLSGHIFHDASGNKWKTSDLDAWKRYEKKIKELSKNQGIKAKIVLKNEQEADLIISVEPLTLSIKKVPESFEGESKKEKIKRMIQNQNLEGIKPRFPE